MTKLQPLNLLEICKFEEIPTRLTTWTYNGIKGCYWLDLLIEPGGLPVQSPTTNWVSVCFINAEFQSVKYIKIKKQAGPISHCIINKDITQLWL